MMNTQRIYANEEAQFAVLPDNMTRGQLEGLLMDVSKYIGMSDSLLKSLLTMIRYTRPSDWTDPSREPVCSKMQCDIALQLDKTDRAVRNDEKSLAGKDFGFIRKYVSANGSRRGAGEAYRQGLIFTPLIEKVADLLALRAQMQEEGVYKKTLRLKCSALRRNIKNGLMELHPKFPDNSDLKAIADLYLSWPRRYTEFNSIEALEAHYDEVLATSEEIDELRQMLGNTSAGAEVNFRPYIQDTTQDDSVECNININKRTDDKSSDAHLLTSAPNGSDDCLENKYAAANVECNHEFIEKLNPFRLFAMCSDEMQFYVKGYQGSRSFPNMMDFVQAGISRLPELGINPTAYDAAVTQMGEFAAGLCILIIDRNRTHPVTPIFNPGGTLRAMTKRHKAGQLNIYGSLKGITERQKEESEDENDI